MCGMIREFLIKKIKKKSEFEVNIVEIIHICLVRLHGMRGVSNDKK